jgi:RNA polymerase sigma-70 factor (ECF subfamily)
MQTEVTSSAQDDASAVAAVRRGDAERYRELVERHERRVYAVAWSRLGDAALAEEVTQEAFIRAYRRLWLLGDGAKFSGWVNTIARRMAINFGLRHRRELDKRERWALENPEVSTAENPADEAIPPYTPEMLRQTLAELPAAHRECLVLFYLEDKSGAEAAAALGISEAALRVRLHRARAVMRERLEEKLEGSLAKLRPAKTLVPAVMAGVLASSSAKAATAGGAGATILAALAKFTPFKWLFALGPLVFPLFMILPGLFFHRWRTRDEQRNYRDQKGFAPVCIGGFTNALWRFLRC